MGSDNTNPVICVSPPVHAYNSLTFEPGGFHQGVDREERVQGVDRE